MKWSRLTLMMQSLFRRKVSGPSKAGPRREPQIHVIILDGTMSSMAQGMETNAGHAYRLVSELIPPVSLYYEAGVQFTRWRNAPDVMMGRGINRQIRRAYGFLASRYRPGDKIFLMGYSRGAFAVRSLAGVIDQVGLLSAEHATERNVRLAYRHYECDPNANAASDFARVYCHDSVQIEMIGVWDTVKALGIRLPVLWRWSEEKHKFHNHHLGESVKHGFQALGMDETRMAYDPVLWESRENWPGKLEQVWFKGSHSDVGGHLDGHEETRPLSNIPLVWMMERAEACGLPLPQDWRSRFPQDAQAPSIGTWRGWGKIFLLRSRRNIGHDPSERIHDSVENKPAKRDRFKLPFRRRA